MKKNIKNKILLIICLGILSVVVFALYNTYQRATSPLFVPNPNITNDTAYRKIVFSGGCFWCTESEFNHTTGVVSAISGFAASPAPNPSYADVSSEKVKAREAVLVIYDPKKVSEEELLEIYWKHIDPTDTGGQFSDRGYQYTTAIYYTTPLQALIAETQKEAINKSKKFAMPVTTEILPFVNFYPAEEYHQDYKDKNPVRYTAYREGSGRNTFIKNNWTNEAFLKEVFGRVEKTSMNNEEKVEQKEVSEPWKYFTPEMKAAKLKMLTPVQFSVTQKANTEKPFTNEYAENEEKGIYVDVVSGEPLYLSSDKFDSGTGWPSFVKPVSNDALVLKVDEGFFSDRTEVRSKIADSHLGHVFNDGPADRGGKRYCMNSAALRFVPLALMEKEGYGVYVGLIK